MPRPDFLGIGAQRAGTTFLHTALAGHPQIIMPRTGTDAWNKEQHFFNRFVLSSDLSEYEAVFADPDKSGARVAGEITPAYAILPRYLVRTVAEYLAPDSTHIIFVVRNPMDRVISAYKQFHANKARPTGMTRLTRAWRFVSYAERPGVVRRTAYDNTLANWRAVYGKDRVLVLSFDSLERQPIQTLRRVAHFLGADPDWFDEARVSTERVYPSRTADVPELARAYVAWRWLPTMRQFNAQMGGELGAWVADLEKHARDLGWTTRALFRAVRVAGAIRHLARRRRLERQFRRVDARLRDLISRKPSRPVGETGLDLQGRSEAAP